MRDTLSALARAFVAKRRMGWHAHRLRASMPPYARAFVEQDARGILGEDRGAAACIQQTRDWLLRAQTNSATNDGGVARHFSLIDGWGASYPETTGYIVPTFIDEARVSGDQRLLVSAKRMLD